MNEASQTTTTKTSAGEKLGNTALTAIKNETVASAPRGSIKDMGRVHVGAGMMRY